MSKPATVENDMSNMNLKNMRKSAEAVSTLLKSMSHPERLMLLCQLTQGEFCVSDLEKRVGLGQPSLSQQLGILRKDGLVKTRKESKKVFYSVNNEHALAVLKLLYERFCNTPSTQNKKSVSIFNSNSSNHLFTQGIGGTYTNLK